MAYQKAGDTAHHGGRKETPRSKPHETYRRLCSEAGVSFGDFLEAMKSHPDESTRDFARRMSALTSELIRLKREKRKAAKGNASAPMQLSFLLAPGCVGNGAANSICRTETS